MAYLGWLRQEDGIVGEEGGGTFLCFCVSQTPENCAVGLQESG